MCALRSDIILSVSLLSFLGSDLRHFQAANCTHLYQTSGLFGPEIVRIRIGPAYRHATLLARDHGLLEVRNPPFERCGDLCGPVLS